MWSANCRIWQKLKLISFLLTGPGWITWHSRGSHAEESRKRETGHGAHAFIRVHGWSSFAVSRLWLDWSVQVQGWSLISPMGVLSVPVHKRGDCWSQGLLGKLDQGTFTYDFTSCYIGHVLAWGTRFYVGHLSGNKMDAKSVISWNNLAKLSTKAKDDTFINMEA